MADPKDMWPDNVGGFSIAAGKIVSFYVDSECILCSVCADAAPENFRLSDDEDHDIVYKQPENEKEFEQCLDAMASCPVDAIGDDGAK
jgi:ferredoxin